MASPSDRLQILLTVKPDDPAVLELLEFCLQHELLSSEEVQSFTYFKLSCPLPARSPSAAVLSPVSEVRSQSPRPTSSEPAVTPKPARPPSLVGQALSSLMAEISVIWLLFLGVFMVVVSSAVLAASQWENFSAIGQYAILLGYTLVFGGVGLWTGRQENLRLTSRMLQIATLLLIPVNFWMIDGFNLWQSPTGLAIGAIAALVLAALNFQLLRSQSRLTWLNTVGLSLLHWGWAIPGLPLIATYAGTIGTAALQIFDQRHDRGTENRGTENRETENPATEDHATENREEIGQITVAFATLLLLGRAVLGRGIPVSQLGLAIGICGWLLCWLNRTQARPLWSQVGIGLLLLGWLAAVTADQQAQSLGVSLLALWLLFDRLRRLWRVQELVAIVLVGWQTYSLLQIVLPLAWRNAVVSTIAGWAGLTYNTFGSGQAVTYASDELTGLGSFAYLVILVGFAAYLHRQQQSRLAIVTERITLGLGFLLAVPGLFEPWVRAMYLSLSTVLLGLVLWQRYRTNALLIYLTHTTGVAALLAWIAWRFSSLSPQQGAIVLLVVAVVEWMVAWRVRDRAWQTSAWYLALGLTSISYWLLNDTSFWDLPWLAAQNWREDDSLPALTFLLAPLCLTFLGTQRQFPYAQQATRLSTITLLLLPTLTITSRFSSLIGLTIATVLMLLNTHQWQKLVMAAITIGFGLGAATVAVPQIFGELKFEQWLLWGSIVVWGLRLLWQLTLRRSERRSTQLTTHYTNALNGWAIAGTTLSLMLLSLFALYLLTTSTAVPWQFSLASGLIAAAIAYRLWQQPTDLGFYGLAWSVELLLFSVLSTTAITPWAIANLALALATQLAGDFWLRRSARLNLSSFYLVPILFASVGMTLGHQQFTATTGLYTFAAAMVAIGIGRRRSDLKPITLVSVLVASIAAYEWLIYRLINAPSTGALGDAVVLLAGLATAIALVYSLLARWLLPYLRFQPTELSAITHVHWAIGSALILLAPVLSLSSLGSNLWIGVMLALAGYALWRGRTVSTWVYFGLAQGLLVLVDRLDQFVPEPLLLAWGGAIAALIGLALYYIPWQRLGWSKTPWQRSALVLPGLTVLLTPDSINIQSLLIIGGFYGWLASATRQIRLSYLSLVLAVWAGERLLQTWNLTDPLWHVTLLSNSLLYVVQVDPALAGSQSKEVRHWLRCLAIGLFCLTALVQSEGNWIQGLLTIALGIGLIAAGLILRIRALLYIGTLTFLFKVLRQLWLFISDYSLTLWALGILLGLALIWIAATFESRRSQAIAFVQYWVTELDAWE
jgi:hypothetical protein